jgi:hypothetical protein
MKQYLIECIDHNNKLTHEYAFNTKAEADKCIMIPRDDVKFYRITIPNNADLGIIFPDREKP